MSLLVTWKGASRGSRKLSINNDFSKTKFMYNNEFRNTVTENLEKLWVKFKILGRKTNTYKICFFVIKLQT